MKRTDLKFPFKWEERQPAIYHRVLFVPAFYQQHAEWTFPGWEDPQLFGNNHPVHIEYCAGNGAWILQKAIENPHINWVAVEQKFERVRKIWIKSQRLSLPNVIVVCGEALTFTKFYLASNSLDAIYVNFPDPWPKERHAKNRLIQKPFVEELARVVKDKGKAILVTDDIPYSRQMCHEMLQNVYWSPSFPDPYFKTEWENYGNSYFDSLWREKGRTIHYIPFFKSLKGENRDEDKSENKGGND